ncbi:hypothetical protein Scep_020259 [Stephania cephalantha]|uniref:Uncharacterized protein n=1 Tax=Stephania cephalantha TaxID=152367 RepID=A0AAP0ICU8_9MAGN
MIEFTVFVIAGDENLRCVAEETRSCNVGGLLGIMGIEERVVCDQIEPVFGHQFESEDGLDGQSR